MGKAIPTATFRRAPTPPPEVVAAFVNLDDAPGDTPVASVVVPIPPAPASAMTGSPGVPTGEAFDPIAATPPGDPRGPVTTQQKERQKKWRRKVLRRADGRELRKQTFYLDAELSHRLMVTCAEREYDLSEAIEEAVNLWLKRRSA